MVLPRWVHVNHTGQQELEYGLHGEGQYGQEEHYLQVSQSGTVGYYNSHTSPYITLSFRILGTNPQ